MFSELLLAAAFQIGPFYEQKDDAAALRPFWSTEGQTTDVVWPLYTKHDAWWRFCFVMHYQEHDHGYQFMTFPLWWNGEDNGESYYALFPIAGHHPHFLFMKNIDFVLWPIWMRYQTPRGRELLTTNAVLWPFVHWRSDGSWGVWPLYTCNHQRESFHQSVLWPIVTWATYEEDRDTSGAGSSWMFWPLAGGVTREREEQWLFLPPLFSYARTPCPGGERSVPEMRLSAPWPFFEYESTLRRDRLSIWPLYETVTLKAFSGEESSSVTRFGWKLVELYDDETRVFPFWVSRKDDTYFRFWPFWESSLGEDGVRRGRFLSLFPIRNVPAVDRNWAKFWTFYERAEGEKTVDHALFWGLIRWSTDK